MKKLLRFSKIRDVKSPSVSPDSAGIDFYIPEDTEARSTIMPHEDIIIPSGIKVDISKGYALVAFNRSSIAIQGLIVGACVIDSGYQGEIHLHIINTTGDKKSIKPGQKLVQFLLLPVPEVDLQQVPAEELYSSPSIRGEGGFGSTGD